MIIKISQTISKKQQLYDIVGENFYWKGNTGNISRLQSITLTDTKTTIKGIYNISKWVNYIPLRHLWGEANLTRVFHLYRNEDIYGCIIFSKHGFLKSFYVIALDSGEIFHCYCRSIGSFNYVSIYQDDKQIALIETYLNVNDFKYIHKLYILNTHDIFADTLSFFVLYYASYTFARRLHTGKISMAEKACSFSKYNDRHNQRWREIHFPHENFFGKTNPMNNLYGDI